MKTTATKLIRVGHSPDPDDAFMFYALAHEKIDMRGFKVEHVIEDIESLNQRALGKLKKDGGGRMADGVKSGLSSSPREDGSAHRFVADILHPPSSLLEVTAVSCHAYAYLADRYAVMRSGASVGDNYGPILVAQKQDGGRRMAPAWPVGRDGAKPNSILHPPSSLRKRVAVSGELTTAYLVLQLYIQEQDGGRRMAVPIPINRSEAEIGAVQTTTLEKNKKVWADGGNLKNKGLSPSSILPPSFEAVFVPFDKIMDAVKSGEVDYGLVIHEGQITHAEYGLEKVLDLGEWWHQKTGLPLPLGIDVIRKHLGRETMESFAKLFKESIEYALNHRKDALEYASQFGRGISGDLNDRFVAMYVNERTLDLGKDGEAGFRRLLDMAYEHRIIPKKVELEFI